MSELRPDLAAIAAMIRPGARVLDVGCGDGALLEHLKTKNVPDGMSAYYCTLGEFVTKRQATCDKWISTDGTEIIEQ